MKFRQISKQWIAFGAACPIANMKTIQPEKFSLRQGKMKEIGKNLFAKLSFPLDFAFQWYRLISRRREKKDEDTETGIDI